MYGKLLIIFLFFIANIEACGKCPDAGGAVTGGGPVHGVECTVVPGCNYLNNGSLTPIATQCSNELDDASCIALFPCPLGTPGNYIPVCELTAAGTPGDPTTFPMVRAPACLIPSLQSIALKCK